MSTTEQSVPEWPGLAGWFGLLLALVWLIDPASFTRPLPTLTVGFVNFGLYRHVQHADWAPPGRRP